MRLPGVGVRDVAFGPDRLVVIVAVRRRLLAGAACSFVTASRYDTRPVASQWRHLDLGAWRLELRPVLRRGRCPAHGAVREEAPCAREGSQFTRGFEDGA